MSYDTSRIQQEGWIFEIGEEAGSEPIEHGKGKGRKDKDAAQKARDRDRHRELRKLRKQGLVKPQEITKIPDWIECVKCFAKIGIGSTKSARLIGVNSTTICVWRKRLGIKVVKPRDNLPLYGINYVSEEFKIAEAKRLEQKRKDVIYNRILKDAHKLTMEIKKSIQPMHKTYSNLTKDQKRERFRKRKEREIRIMGVDGYKKFVAEKRAKWRSENLDKHRAAANNSTRNRKLVDPGFRVQCNLRNRHKDLMTTARRGGSSSISSLIGCSTKQLAKYLESGFKRGMTWKNYGDHWHVDHILPCESFDHTDDRQEAQCWHWTNLRPLEARLNMDKGASITEPQMQLLLCATH